ncbi:hypothetical protein CLU79DRAFT_686343, partial [Phycomyces nitens]
ATLNFKHIIFCLCRNGRRLERFYRSSAKSSTNLKRKKMLDSSSSRYYKTKQ